MIVGNHHGIAKVRNAKVGDFDSAFFIPEQIGRFDVAVDDALIVEVFETADDVAENTARLVYGKLGLALVVLPRDLAAFHILEHHKDLFALWVIDDLFELDDVAVTALFHDRNLASHFLVGGPKEGLASFFALLFSATLGVFLGWDPTILEAESRR